MSEQSTPSVAGRENAPGLGNAGAFVLMTLIWGRTWAAVKVGVMAVPPIFFAILRYALVAAILAVTVRGVAALPDRALLGRIIVTGLMINAGTYAFLFWGMQFIPSGVSGLVNLSLIPIGLFSLSIVFGNERANWRHAVALMLGTAGLVLLFSNKASVSGNVAELKGVAAIVIGTFCYCLGTMLSRPLLTSITRGHAGDRRRGWPSLDLSPAGASVRCDAACASRACASGRADLSRASGDDHRLHNLSAAGSGLGRIESRSLRLPFPHSRVGSRLAVIRGGDHLA